MNKNLLIIAGEASGDLHGAELIKALKALDNELNITGIGGDKMKSAGMELIYHINQMAFLGFVEVIRHLPFITKVRNQIIQTIEQKEIDTVVLIDYPGFNLNLAKKLSGKKVNVIYYISPQIWAWGGGRIKKILKYVNKMLVILPFEQQLYAKAGMDAEFVGHPLLEQFEKNEYLEKEELFGKFGLDRGKEILLILPGSRHQEIKKLFPPAIEAAEKLSKEFKLQTVIACSSNIAEEEIKPFAGKYECKIIKGHTYELMRYAKLGIIKSGTSTLEAGLLNLPMVVVYATSPLTYLIGRKLIKINNIALVNIVSGQTVVKELIQHEASEEGIYAECKKLLTDAAYYSEIKNKLISLREKLGVAGASKRAAEIIHVYLTENKRIDL